MLSVTWLLERPIYLSVSLLSFYSRSLEKMFSVNRLSSHTIYIYIKVKVKWSRYRPGAVQRVGRGIALLFHDRGNRRWWVVSSMPRPHFTTRKDPVRILQDAEWATGSVWMGGKSRPHRDSIPDRPAVAQSLYRLSYPAHIYIYIYNSLFCIYSR